MKIIEIGYECLIEFYSSIFITSEIWLSISDFFWICGVSSILLISINITYHLISLFVGVSILFMIHSAFKASRIGDDREFFMLKPDEALEQMKIVAEGLEGKVIVFDEDGKEKKVFDYSK